MSVSLKWPEVSESISCWRSLLYSRVNQKNIIWITNEHILNSTNKGKINGVQILVHFLWWLFHSNPKQVLHGARSVWALPGASACWGALACALPHLSTHGCCVVTGYSNGSSRQVSGASSLSKDFWKENSYCTFFE